MSTAARHAKDDADPLPGPSAQAAELRGTCASILAAMDRRCRLVEEVIAVLGDGAGAGVVTQLRRLADEAVFDGARLAENTAAMRELAAAGFCAEQAVAAGRAAERKAQAAARQGVPRRPRRVTGVSVRPLLSVVSQGA